MVHQGQQSWTDGDHFAENLGITTESVMAHPKSELLLGLLCSENPSRKLSEQVHMHNHSVGSELQSSCKHNLQAMFLLHQNGITFA